MSKLPRFQLLFIILITILSIIINLPTTIFPVKFSVNIPLVNKIITVDKSIGIDGQSILKNIGIDRNIAFKKGLDLEGGTSITLKADMKDIATDKRDSALESAKDVIERRVNFFGVSEAIVQTRLIH